MPRLRVKLKKNVLEANVSHAPFVVGRADDADFTIPSGYVSRYHCEILQDADDYRLVDKGSKLGTFLNGARVESAILNLGDVIKLANRIEMVFMGDTSVSNTETLIAQAPAIQHDYERLVALSGPLAGQEFTLRHEVTRLGRSPQCDIVIEVDTVSTQHAEITREDGHFVIHDLESGNGTFVGTERIKRHILKPGDVFLVDWVPFRFEEVHFRMEGEGTRISANLPVPPLRDDVVPGRPPVDRTLQMGAAIPRPTERMKAIEPDKPQWPWLVLLGILGLGACGLVWWFL